jgi:hypothetical protein
MPSIIDRVVFHEPSGNPHALLMFSGSLTFLAIYVYYWILGSPPSVAAIFISVGFALSGIAESLPKDQRRKAGAIRIISMTVLMGLIVTVIFAPDFV